jgi:hypothetical protein
MYQRGDLSGRDVGIKLFGKPSGIVCHKTNMMPAVEWYISYIAIVETFNTLPCRIDVLMQISHLFLLSECMALPDRLGQTAGA